MKEEYNSIYDGLYYSKFSSKLGLDYSSEDKGLLKELIDNLFEVMDRSKIDFTHLFLKLEKFNLNSDLDDF